MKITYYLDKGKVENLYCRINDGKEQIAFSLDTVVDSKDWDAKNETVGMDSGYLLTLFHLKKYISEKCVLLKNEGKEDILELLKNEVILLMKDSGLQSIAENLFDYYNKPRGLPECREFIQAFEKFSKLTKGQYRTDIMDTLICFHTEDKSYIMETYEGRKHTLKSFLECRSYDEIYTETDWSIWSEIYMDPGIIKSEFMPVFLSEWEIYWRKQYQLGKEFGEKTNHLDEMKQKSWRQVQVFMACLDNGVDVIRLADNFNGIELLPIAVISMLQIYDSNTCYDEYCELDFFGCNDWQSISLGDDAPMFFIQQNGL